MQLTKTQIMRYQAIYEKRFGVSLSEERALEEGLALLRLVKKIALLNSNNEKENYNVQSGQPNS